MAITIKDIAKESGYAISTVSRVLNNHADVSETAKEKILAVVEEKKFRLNSNAKHLKQRQSEGVDIIVKGTMNMLFAIIVETIQELTENSPYPANIHYLDEEEDEVEFALQLCRERHPVGLCFLGGLTDNFRRGFAHIHLPSVLVTMAGEELGFSNLSSVSVDDFGGAVCALEHLLEEGHRSIGLIGGDLERSGPTAYRLAGCQQVFDRYHIPIDFATQYQVARYDYQGGYVAMCSLLERMPELTAVFCMADVMAMGALRALSDSGRRVPEDISLVGYDGVPIAQFSIPRLATIRQDAREIARQTVALLEQSIAHGGEVHHIHIPFEWIPGESVAPPQTSIQPYHREESKSS